jgi:colanic acid biosynthesis glycosyl transferase WcaI
MRILILNQYAPPDPAPTARLVSELAEVLVADGHSVVIVGTDQHYRRPRSKKEIRLIRELRALTRLFFRGLKSEHPDIILSTSSPPGLLVLATTLCLLKRTRSVHWAMDLYPDLVFALGKKLPVLLRAFLNGVTKWCYRRAAKVVTLDADMQQRIWVKYGVRSEIIRPWLLHRKFPPDLNYPPREEFTWLYSGNLGRAHDWKTLVEAQAELEKANLQIGLVFQGHGSGSLPARESAELLGLRNVTWLPYAPEESVVEALLAHHVMVVTQKTAAQGLLWPSKLGLVMILPRPIVFVGPTSGAIAQELSRECGAKAFEPGDAHGLANHIEGIYRSWPPGSAPEIRPAFSLSQAAELWKRVLNDALQPATTTGWSLTAGERTSDPGSFNK